MSASLKELAADFRRVRETPAPSTWGKGEVALQKLLKAIDAMPDQVPAADFRAVLEVALLEAHGRAGYSFDVSDALEAYDRVRRER